MRYLISFLLVLVSLTAFSEDTLEKELLLQLNTAEGEDKLRILHKLQQTFLYEPKDRYYNNMLLEEAQKQNNTRYTAIALSSQMVYFYRDFNTDSLYYYAEMAEKFDAEHKQYDKQFQVKDVLVKRYVEQGNYSLALKKAFEMKDEASLLNDYPDVHIYAYMALSYVYQSLGQYDEAIHYANEALRIYVPNEDSPYNTLSAYTIMITSNLNKGNKEKVFLYTDSLCNEIQFIHENYPVYNLWDFEVACTQYMAYFYIETKQQKEAEEEIEKLNTMLLDKGDFPFHRFQVDWVMMHYYRAIGDYERCWEFYHICHDYCMENNLESDMRSLLRFKANTLSMLGQYDQSTQAYGELMTHIDSINRERFIYEINRLRMEYELDRKEDEIEHQEERLNLTVRFVIILSLLVLALIALANLILNSLRSIRNKNFSLFNQISELNTTKKELMEFKDMLQSRIPSAIKSDEDTPEDRLFDKIESYMREKSPYTQTDYRRKELITDINTNEVYLAKAIKKRTNLTVHEYINRWRMEYAKQLLLENMNLTVEAVANDSGFASIRNFYRLFKEEYGMSPAEFRNYVVDNYKPKAE